MDGDSPCQSYGKLGEGAQHFFFNFFFLFVVFIANVFPVLRLDVTFFPIISDDIERFFYLIESTDYTDSAVYPAAVEIILDKYDLCTRFQHKLTRSGQTAFGKVAGDFSPEGNSVSGQFCQFPIIDIIYVIAARSEGDIHIFLIFFDVGSVAGVE